MFTESSQNALTSNITKNELILFHKHSQKVINTQYHTMNQ